MAPSPRVVGATVALLIAIWGTTWAAIRISLGGIPPLSGVAIRFFLAGLMLTALARLIRAPWGGSSPRVRWFWLCHAVLCFCVSYGITYWAEQWVPTGLASVLFATYPLFVVLFAQLLLVEERLRAGVALGSLVGFGGVVVIFSEDFARLGGSEALIPAMVLMLAPMAAGLDSVIVKRWGGGLHPVTLNAASMLATAGIMTGVALGAERHRAWDLAPAPVLATLYLALVGSAVAFSLFFWLLRHTSATRLSTIAYGIPVVAVTVGALAFGEPLTWRLASGAVLIIVGVAATHRS